MINAIFPSNPIEPWHAIFPIHLNDDEKGVALGLTSVYKSARLYGQYVVDMGFARDYRIICTDRSVIHCVPHNGSSFGELMTKIYRFKSELDFNGAM